MPDPLMFGCCNESGLGPGGMLDENRWFFVNVVIQRYCYAPVWRARWRTVAKLERGTASLSWPT